MRNADDVWRGCSDVGCKTVANMIKGKTPEEIRKLFNIVNDFTHEEEVSALSLLCAHVGACD